MERDPADPADEQATRTRSSYISRISSKYAETLDPRALTYENCYLKDDEWLSIDARSNGAFALCVFTRDKWYEIEQDWSQSESQSLFYREQLTSNSYGEFPYRIGTGGQGDFEGEETYRVIIRNLEGVRSKYYWSLERKWLEVYQDPIHETKKVPDTALLSLFRLSGVFMLLVAIACIAGGLHGREFKEPASVGAQPASREEQEGKKSVQKSSQDIFEMYSKKYPHNPEGVLEFHISRKMKQGKTREQAILELTKEIKEPVASINVDSRGFLLNVEPCPFCGANLSLSPDRKTAYCKYCEKEMPTVEKLREN